MFMAENSKCSYYEMFEQACAFVDCADYCEIEPNNIERRFRSHTVADIVNSAFACEVFIKALLVFFGEKSPQGHELKNLWKKYRKKDVQTASKVESYIIRQFNSENKDLFDKFISSASNAYVDWRYIYEAQNKSIRVNIHFLRFFRKALREVCCKQFYNKSWEEFKEEKSCLTNPKH